MRGLEARIRETDRWRTHCLWTALSAIGVLLVSYAPANGQDTLALDLPGTMERALLMSPELLAAQAAAEASEAQVRQVQSLRFLPEGEFTTAFSAAPGVTNPNGVSTEALYLDPAVRNDFGNLNPYFQSEVSLLQPLFTWGALGGGIRAAGAGLEVQIGMLEGRRLAAALRAGELYYDLLLAMELYRLAERVGDVVSQAMREIDRLLQEGDPDVDDADRYQVLITQQEYARRVVEVTEKRVLARSAMQRQLMLPQETVVMLSAEFLTPLAFAPAPLGQYRNAALQYRPELAQAQAGLVARDALIRVARAEYYPQVAAAFALNTSGAANRYRQPNPYVSDGFRRTGMSAGVGIRQKLNFSQTRARVRRAEAQRDEVRHLLTAAEQLVHLEVEQAWRNLEVERAALAAQDSALAISKEWLRVEYINFDLDLGDTENLVRAVQASLELEARYFEAVRRYNVAVLRLLAASGLLIREMNSLAE
ncbi:MAG: TolC family protein [Bacteroidota bacterium]|nr:TolC family protein [Bacteroidota bacterium]